MTNIEKMIMERYSLGSEFVKNKSLNEAFESKKLSKLVSNNPYNKHVISITKIALWDQIKDTQVNTFDVEDENQRGLIRNLFKNAVENDNSGRHPIYIFTDSDDNIRFIQTTGEINNNITNPVNPMAVADNMAYAYPKIFDDRDYIKRNKMMKFVRRTLINAAGDLTNLFTGENEDIVSLEGRVRKMVYLLLQYLQNSGTDEKYYKIDNLENWVHSDFYASGDPKAILNKICDPNGEFSELDTSDMIFRVKDKNQNINPDNPEYDAFMTNKNPLYSDLYKILNHDLFSAIVCASYISNAAAASKEYDPESVENLVENTDNLYTKAVEIYTEYKNLDTSWSMLTNLVEDGAEKSFNKTTIQLYPEYTAKVYVIGHEGFNYNDTSIAVVHNAMGTVNVIPRIEKTATNLYRTYNNSPLKDLNYKSLIQYFKSFGDTDNSRKLTISDVEFIRKVLAFFYKKTNLFKTYRSDGEPYLNDKEIDTLSSFNNIVNDEKTGSAISENDIIIIGNTLNSIKSKLSAEAKDGLSQTMKEYLENRIKIIFKTFEKFKNANKKTGIGIFDVDPDNSFFKKKTAVNAVMSFIDYLKMILTKMNANISEIGFALNYNEACYVAAIFAQLGMICRKLKVSDSSFAFVQNSIEDEIKDPLKDNNYVSNLCTTFAKALEAFYDVNINRGDTDNAFNLNYEKLMRASIMRYRSEDKKLSGDIDNIKSFNEYKTQFQEIEKILNPDDLDKRLNIIVKGFNESYKKHFKGFTESTIENGGNKENFAITDLDGNKEIYNVLDTNGELNFDVLDADVKAKLTDELKNQILYKAGKAKAISTIYGRASKKGAATGDEWTVLSNLKKNGGFPFTKGFNVNDVVFYYGISNRKPISVPYYYNGNAFIKMDDYKVSGTMGAVEKSKNIWVVDSKFADELNNKVTESINSANTVIDTINAAISKVFGGKYPSNEDITKAFKNEANSKSVDSLKALDIDAENASFFDMSNEKSGVGRYLSNFLVNLKEVNNTTSKMKMNLFPIGSKNDEKGEPIIKDLEPESMFDYLAALSSLNTYIANLTENKSYTGKIVKAFKILASMEVPFSSPNINTYKGVDWHTTKDPDTGKTFFGQEPMMRWPELNFFMISIPSNIRKDFDGFKNAIITGTANLLKWLEPTESDTKYYEEYEAIQAAIKGLNSEFRNNINECIRMFKECVAIIDAAIQRMENMDFVRLKSISNKYTLLITAMNEFRKMILIDELSYNEKIQKSRSLINKYRTNLIK